MKQSEAAAATMAGAQSTWSGIERKRVEKVVEALAALRNRGDSLPEVAHDARNMVTALTLYCDLLESPGVLGDAFAHYAQELRLVAAASRRLVEKLLALDAGTLQSLPEVKIVRAAAGQGAEGADPNAAAGSVPAPGSAAAPRIVPWPAAVANRASVADEIDDRIGNASGARAEDRTGDRVRRGDLLPALPVANLAAELVANGNLLAALAGSAIALTIETDGSVLPVRLTGEDLTRLLVNLVKNAAEAMPKDGRIAIGLRAIENSKGGVACLALTVEDSGPGIPEEALKKIFTSGYTSRAKEAALVAGWPQNHRGLGLAIVRSIVEDAGGRITAANRPQGGACFTIELPVRRTGAGAEELRD